MIGFIRGRASHDLDGGPGGEHPGVGHWEVAPGESIGSISGCYKIHPLSNFNVRPGSGNL